MNTPQNVRYFLYARKSSESDDRQMASIESQVEELRKFSQQENLKIVSIFSEAKSAKAPGREIFTDMLRRIKAGEAEGIICWKLNRLARNPVDGGEVSWLLQQGIIKHIATVGRSYYPTDNVLMMAVELGMANQFLRDLSTDTKRGLKTKAERGYYPAHATVGYSDNPLRRKGEKEIIVDTERFPLVRRMFDLMLTGTYTPPMILDIATNEWNLRMPNGAKMARSTAYRILTDPFYYGEFEYPKKSGKWYQGAHEPMISREEYEKIQMLLGKKGSPRFRKKSFAYTGLIRCWECDCLITAEDKKKEQKNGNVHHYTYYRCTKRRGKCSQKTIRDSILESQIENELLKISIAPEFKEWALEVLKEENHKQFSSTKLILDSQRKSYDNCLEEFDGLVSMRAKGEIDDSTFQRRKAFLEKEKLRLNGLLKEADKNIDNWLEKAEQLFGFAEVARFRFETGSIPEKRAIFAALGSNLLLKDRKLLISSPNELIFIQKAVIEERAIRNRLEPLGFGSNKTKLRAEYTQSSSLLTKWYDFRNSDPLLSYPNFEYCVRLTQELLN